MRLTRPPKDLEVNGLEPEHLKVDMRCQMCDYHWSYEFFGILWDVGQKITGCPSCGVVKRETGRPSLELLRMHVVYNPYMVKERK